jgi:hypothetical protein
MAHRWLAILTWMCLVLRLRRRHRLTHTTPMSNNHSRMGSNTRRIWRWIIRLSYNRRTLPNGASFSHQHHLPCAQMRSGLLICKCLFHLLRSCRSRSPLNVCLLPCLYLPPSVSLAAPSLSPPEDLETVFFHHLLGTFPRLFIFSIDHPKGFASLRYTGRYSTPFSPSPSISGFFGLPRHQVRVFLHPFFPISSLTVFVTYSYSVYTCLLTVYTRSSVLPSRERTNGGYRNIPPPGASEWPRTSFRLVLDSATHRYLR